MNLWSLESIQTSSLCLIEDRNEVRAQQGVLFASSCINKHSQARERKSTLPSQEADTAYTTGNRRTPRVNMKTLTSSVSSGKYTLWKIWVVLCWMASTSTRWGGYFLDPFLSVRKTCFKRIPSNIGDTCLYVPCGLPQGFLKSLHAVWGDWMMLLGLQELLDMRKQHVTGRKKPSAEPEKLPALLLAVSEHTELLSADSVVKDFNIVNMQPWSFARRPLGDRLRQMHEPH